MQSILAVLIAVGIPVVFLVIIYTLDLYASRTFALVLVCAFWGALGGLGLSFLFNTYVAVPFITRMGWSLLLLFVVFAPIAEEILKSLSLFYIARRPEFTYFVDGAIYGFAAGIGFSITENFLYMSQGAASLGVMLVRSFSTCLMHGTASALVGAAVGRFRFQKRSGRGLAMLGGWLAAIILHAIFNSIARNQRLPQGLVVPLLVALGLAGVGLIAFFINLGLREQRNWFAETLDREVGVSGAEVRAAQGYASIDEKLKPLAQQFPKKAEAIEALVLYQAQMGIKMKVQRQVSDPRIKEQLSREIAELQKEMERLRKKIGGYAMIFVRSVFPLGEMDLWADVAQRAPASDGPVDQARWMDIGKRAEASQKKAPMESGIFKQAQVKTPPRQEEE